MFCLALTLLSATLLAADYKVYEITGTKEGFTGLYVETSRPSLSFQRIGRKVDLIISTISLGAQHFLQNGR